MHFNAKREIDLYFSLKATVFQCKAWNPSVFLIKSNCISMPGVKTKVNFSLKATVFSMPGMKASLIPFSFFHIDHPSPPKQQQRLELCSRLPKTPKSLCGTQFWLSLHHKYKWRYRHKCRYRYKYKYKC